MILLPALATYTDRTPEDVIWIDCTLDFQKASVVTTPEGLLPVWFIDVALRAESALVFGKK